jgi:signal transduction histidine kinase
MAALVVVVAVLLSAAIAAGVVAVAHINTVRGDLLGRVDPEVAQANQFTTALLDQETGVRGYQLTGRSDFLQPYQQGVQQQNQAVGRLRSLGATSGTQAGDDLDLVLRRAATWRAVIADPTVADPKSVTQAQVDTGRARFEQVRAALAIQQAHLEQARQLASARLRSAGAVLDVVLASIAGLLIVLFVLLYLIVRRYFVRPVLRLAAEVRAVAGADIERSITVSGPRELVELAGDTDAMRRRIVTEVGRLEQAQAVIATRGQELERSNAELARSNADLEQFAYVASHDLQEPLRKVASFCQLLQRRYQSLLDERGNQYIEFAVDGARRMQALINDLLEFSRVGRRPEDFRTVDTERVVRQAVADLGITDSAAHIMWSDLPAVRGLSPLLTTVFQNLIGNALKFRGDTTPEVRITAERGDEEWTFTVADNGIGIDEEYAERIFVIFQRLHSKEKYAGTGIGLAVCRRIVEFHGGRIWLDAGASGPGATFRFTLPAVPEPNDEGM